MEGWSWSIQQWKQRKIRCNFWCSNMLRKSDSSIIMIHWMIWMIWRHIEYIVFICFYYSCFAWKGFVRKEGFSMSWMGMVNFPVAEGPPSAPSSLILNDGDWLPALGNPDVRCEVEQGMQGTLAERPAKLRLSGWRDWLDLCWILISVECFPHKQLRGSEEKSYRLQ